MPRGARTTLFPNIYRDNHGHEIILTRRGREKRQRYNRKDYPNPSLGFLKNERERFIKALESAAAKTAPGTLRAGVTDYLAQLPAGQMKRDRERELAPWVAVWGDWQRSRLTPSIVRGQLAQWQTEGFAPSTLNHRRQALKSLYKALDGPTAPTPCDDVKKAIERQEIRRVPYVAVVAILRRVTPSATGARIKVIARTGLPHAQIARLKSTDVDLKAREISVTPRRKGGGTKARTLGLTYAAVRAFKLMARYKAWGAFSRHSLYKSFHLAVRKAIQHWPKEKGPWPAPANIRPYDLRHAFGSEVYRRTRDLRATAELLLHANLGTTARYAESAVSDTAIAARDAMDRRVPRKVPR